MGGIWIAICVQGHNASCDLLSGRIVGGRADIASPRIKASLLSIVGLPGTEIHEGRQHRICLSGGIMAGTGLPETCLGIGVENQAQARDCRSSHEYQSIQEWIHFYSLLNEAASRRGERALETRHVAILTSGFTFSS